MGHGKSFNEKGAMNRHERIHSGVKPYSCETSGKSFNDSGNIRKHERLHTGERPYNCEICGKSFSLLRHIEGSSY